MKKLQLTVGLSCLASMAFSASPVNLQKMNVATLTSHYPILKTTFAAQNQPSNYLLRVAEHTDAARITHLRLQQMYQGFPVFGGYVIIHHPSKTMVASSSARATGILYENLNKELGLPNPAFTQKAQSILQQLKGHYQQDEVTAENVTPLVYINKEHRAIWAYQVQFTVHHARQIPEKPTFIVDADSKILVTWDDIKTERAAIKGKGYGGNLHTGKYQYGERYPLLSLTMDSMTNTCFMENQVVKVIDMAHRYVSPKEAMHFYCKKVIAQDNVYWTGYRGDGLDRQNGAYSPSNDAFYAGEVIHDLYKNWYGVEVLSSPEKVSKLIMRVHYGENYENAFWDGKQMTFGDGDTLMYPLVSLGIGAHEVSHGFTDRHSGLHYFGESGGLNEAFSDMAAQTAEFYSVGKNSWTIGAEIVKEGSGFEVLRYMDKPSRDGFSIDSADQYIEGLDVHYSSGVYNRMFYLLANSADWNPRKAFAVMVKANMDYWTPYSNFEEAGCGVLNATKDLGYDDSAVRWALQTVAVNVDQCGV